MNKKRLIGIIAGALAVLLVLGALGGYSLWHYQLPKFRDVTLELGSALPPVTAFLTGNGDASKAALVTEASSIDLSRVGVQELTFSHGAKKETVQLNIVDTTAPVLKLQNVSAGMEAKLDPKDFVTEVADLAEVTLTFAKPLQTPEKYGDVTVEIIATDASGNATRESCTLSYIWIRPSLTVELGAAVSKGDILVDVEKYADLLDQAVLDALSAAAVGTYPITATTTDGQTGTCLVTVVDTVKPDLKVKNYEVYEGQTVSVENFVESATDLSGEVTVKLLQEVDTTKAGTYTVTVEATDHSGNVTTADAQLIVLKDTQAPTFSGLEDITVKKGQTPDYTTGVSAADMQDGGVEFTYDDSQVDLTKAGTYVVTYTAVDKAGNQTTQERKITVLVDTEAPVFSGLKDITTKKNKKPNYTSGVKTTDNWDGEVKFTYDTSKVNLSKAGTYYVTYTAVDKAGNTVTARRKVVVDHSQEDTKELVKKIAAGLKNDAEAIRDYVRNSIRYSHDWGGEDPVWYGFKTKKGNCYVHAMCLQELLKEKGFETKLIWVKDKSHYWNMVKIGDTWKHIDATPGTRHTKYSLMNDAERLETLSGRTWDTSKWPAGE